MMIYVDNRSKKKKTPRKQAEQHQEWLSSLEKKYGKVKTVKTKNSKSFTPYIPQKTVIPPERDLFRHPSLNTGFNGGTLKPKPVYTGDAMLGIGTLHKSNAVPIFSKDDAKDQANMRR